MTQAMAAGVFGTLHDTAWIVRLIDTIVRKLLLLTSILGFIIALALFLFAFMTLRLKVGLMVSAAYTGAGITFNGGMAWLLNRSLLPIFFCRNTQTRRGPSHDAGCNPISFDLRRHLACPLPEPRGLPENLDTLAKVLIAMELIDFPEDETTVNTEAHVIAYLQTPGGHVHYENDAQIDATCMDIAMPMVIARASPGRGPCLIGRRLRGRSHIID